MAQQPQPAQPPPAAADAAAQKLDTYLKQWEKAMLAVNSLAASLERIEVSATWKTKKTFTGWAAYLKPNRAMLEMVDKEKPKEVAEKIVITGSYIYQYAMAEKEVRIHQLPPAKQGQVTEDSFLSFLFGMKAEEARRRYDLNLTKEDQWYVYVEIVPRTKEDKTAFLKARLVLHKDTFLPAQLWFVQANNDEVVWNIPQIQNKANLDPRRFEAPEIPAGWKTVTVPKASDAPPRVIRPQN
jgi:TIGR03009 family protein